MNINSLNFVQYYLLMMHNSVYEVIVIFEYSWLCFFPVVEWP